MYQGRIQDFKLGGMHLKKLRRAEGGAKIFGVFRVKNDDFTQKIHIFSNLLGKSYRFIRVVKFCPPRYDDNITLTSDNPNINHAI
jgi:hypothetical protein